MTQSDYASRLIGRRLSRFTVDGLVTHGGMGLIYKGTDTIRHRPVIIKVLMEEILSIPELVRRFEREAEIVQQLRHPNIAHVYSAGTIDDVIPYYVMEFVDGESLAEMLKNRGRIGGHWAIEYLRQATLGLQAAASFDIIHRDIKPANMMVSSGGLLKIVDFGIAKASLCDSFQTTVGQVMGTAMYMSPEQAKGEEVDLRSDIYSLGATFYHVITGHYPYVDDNALRVMLRHVNEPFRPIESLHPNVPPRLRRIIGKMTEKKPADRFQNYDDLLVAIEGIFKTESTKYIPPPASPRPSLPAADPFAPPRKRISWKRITWISGTVLALVGAIALAILIAHWYTGNSDRLQDDEYESRRQLKEERDRIEREVQKTLRELERSSRRSQ